MFNCLIMGAAGRDFHNFQTFFRERSEFRVLAFTAAQIRLSSRRFFQARSPDRSTMPKSPTHDQEIEDVFERAAAFRPRRR